MMTLTIAVTGLAISATVLVQETEAEPPDVRAGVPPTRRAHARALTLLDRHAVLRRDAIAHEEIAPSQMSRGVAMVTVLWSGTGNGRSVSICQSELPAVSPCVRSNSARLESACAGPDIFSPT